MRIFKDTTLNCKNTILALLCLFAQISLAFSENTTGQNTTNQRLALSEIKVSTPRYRPDKAITPRLGIFSYNVSWEGISVASATLQTYHNGDKKIVAVTAKSTRFIDLLYKLRYFAQGEMHIKTLEPITTYINHRENSRQRITNTTFASDGFISSIIDKVNKNERQSHNFTSNNQTFDPFSSSAMAQVLNWQIGQKRDFDVFDGKNRYLITLLCKKKDYRYIQGVKTPVITFEPQVIDKNNNEKVSKLRRATISFTDDEYRDLVELDSDVFIGSIKTSLKSYKPL
jgi:hypothetical protein